MRLFSIDYREVHRLQIEVALHHPDKFLVVDFCFAIPAVGA